MRSRQGRQGRQQIEIDTKPHFPIEFCARTYYEISLVFAIDFHRGFNMRYTVLLATVIVLMMSPLLAAEEQMCIPLGDITLTPLVEEAKRTNVSFPHSVHFSYACQECHHEWDGSAPVQSCSTSECHDLKQAPKTENGEPVQDSQLSIRYYKKAFHDMCIGCHKAIKASNKALEAARVSLEEPLPAVGPTSCNHCHPKE